MAGPLDWIKGRLRGDIDDLIKSEDGDSLATQVQESRPVEEQVGRKAFLDDPYYDQLAGHGIHRQKSQTRLSNKILKDVSLRDWAVSSIIQTRCDTSLLFSRPQINRHDTGYKIIRRDNEPLTAEDQQEAKILEDFIYNCGKVDGTPQEDRYFFGEFLKLLVRDALTFGHVAIEKVLTRKGNLHRFRPIPGESTYLINKTASKSQISQELASVKNVLRQMKNSDNDPSVKYEVNEADLDYYKYIQMGQDGKTLAAFGDKDMIFKLFNPQNFGDANGYCMSLVELAIVNITNHLNVESYNSKFFTHGYAARGLLHLKGTVTQSQLVAFRRQFHNSISGVQNSWRTPIIAGLDDVQWIPMSGSAREMEYIAFNDHILRAICAQFQIDPVEIGLDYLSSGTGRTPLQQANNEHKIAASKERGLHPILMFFEDLVNAEILPAIDLELSRKYAFKFTGYNDTTPQTEIAHMQAEMTVYSSMNDILKKAQLPTLNTPAANLPLNQAFWTLVEKNMTKAEIRETFFGDKTANGKPELAYFPADPAFLQWNNFLSQMHAQQENREMQAEAAKQQQEAMKAQQAQADEQHDMEKEKHKAEMYQHKRQKQEDTLGAAQRVAQRSKLERPEDQE